MRKFGSFLACNSLVIARSWELDERRRQRCEHRVGTSNEKIANERARSCNNLGIIARRAFVILYRCDITCDRRELLESR